MDWTSWVYYVAGGLLIAVISVWLTWSRTNLRRLRVSVAAEGVVANFPIQPDEEHILEVTITNVGNKLVNIEQCWFTMDGKVQHIVVDRSRLATMPEGLPRKLDAAEQCVIKYPAVAFYGKELTKVSVQDYLGKRWYAKSRNVKRVAADLAAFERKTKRG